MSHPFIIAFAMLLLLAVEACAADAGLSPVWPESPYYAISPAVAAQESLLAEPVSSAWQAAEPLGPFYSRRAMEPADRATTVRVCHAAGVLYIAAQCKLPAADLQASAAAGRVPDDALGFYYTEGAESQFPYREIRVTPDGIVTVTRYTRAFPRWSHYFPVEPIDPAGIGVRTGKMSDGWWVVLAIPVEKYGIPTPAFYANVVRQGTAEMTGTGWSDTTGISVNSTRHFGRMRFSSVPAVPEPRVALPATLAVGVNRICLANWRSGLRFEANSAVVPVGADGSAVVEVRERGRARLEIFDSSGAKLSVYRADVRAPLEVEARTSAEGSGITVDLTTYTAGAAGFDVTLEAVQSGKVADTMTVPHSGTKSQTGWAVKNCVPGEVTIRARASVPASSGAMRVEAFAPCAYRVELASFDRFREGLDAGPTRSLYRAALADACNYYRLTQAGDGRYRTTGREGRLSPSEWYYCFVFAMALVYKADWPENPYCGDKRFLDSAVAGMEAGLDPAGGYFAGGYSRHLQAYVLTYELLKDDIEPEREAYWRQRVEEIVDHTLESHLDAAPHITSFYSFDCGTGTNHFAYYVMNLYAAGRALDRPDWTERAREVMLRLAGHAEDGQFAERRGMPATHYTWLTMNALGEYWAQSGDDSVRPVLDRCADFSCNTTLDNDDTMLLHDGRNNTYPPYEYGDFVLTLTPTGRTLARRRLFDHVGGAKKPSGSNPEFWFRTAENAIYCEEGPAEPIPGTAEFAFLDGRALTARKAGFQYGLSAICLPATTEEFWLDPQNAVELHHRAVGPILHGANAVMQPEAGSFMRRVGDGVVFLPVDGRVERTDQGHAARLEFDGFDAQVNVRVLSDTQAEVKVELVRVDGDAPVTCSFFPAAAGQGPEVSEDGKRLDCGKFIIETNRSVAVETGFTIANAYTQKRDCNTKPVRATVQLELYKPLVLRVTVNP